MSFRLRGVAVSSLYYEANRIATIWRSVNMQRLRHLRAMRFVRLRPGAFGSFLRGEFSFAC